MGTPNPHSPGRELHSRATLARNVDAHIFILQGEHSSCASNLKTFKRVFLQLPLTGSLLYSNDYATILFVPAVCEAVD